jgi:hypothetical protein
MPAVLRVVGTTSLDCRKCPAVTQVPVQIRSAYEYLFLPLMLAFFAAFLLLAGTALNAVWPSFHLGDWVFPGGLGHPLTWFRYLPRFILVVALGLTASALFVRFALAVKAGYWAECPNCQSGRRIRRWAEP